MRKPQEEKGDIRVKKLFIACCCVFIFGLPGLSHGKASWNGLSINEKVFFIISYTAGYYDGMREAVERASDAFELNLSEEKKDKVVFRFGENPKLSREEIQKIQILLNKAYADEQNAMINGADMVRLALKCVKSGASEDVFFDLVKDTRELWASERKKGRGE